MSTDITTHGQTPSTALTIADDQSSFNHQQVAALQHLGVQGASDGDLAVFFHVVKRTGLDPFARQIYMIGRWSREGTKYTIQTGIDGYRLIGRRAADARRETISVSAPEWCTEEGQWRPVWRSAWGWPVAARVTIHRGQSPFTAVALFDEYKQTKRDGGLTQMWEQRPAGQIAKCAEALAWRQAFPQDLAGIYVDEEMQQADHTPDPTPEPSSRSGVSRLRAAVPAQDSEQQTPAPEPPPEDVQDAEVIDVPEGITAAQLKRVGSLMTEAGFDRLAARKFVAGVVGREVAARTDLMSDEADRVIAALEAEMQPAEQVAGQTS
ncbi:phage recombination protein Bet [Cellulomonas sp.]|uniref:phage recombination protein Bet n=1 Tax=Cellulomonas sp. TaxID=40001 RepID=UPI001B12D0F9|nr:phage recombination protein Bet [Cellulomonas sp.]MBO9555555.1 phage recombination protein Bet [Cellulomonas sp.]